MVAAHHCTGEKHQGVVPGAPDHPNAANAHT